jgi:hypothetical protein
MTVSQISTPNVPSLASLERWEGGYPGEHEFSTLEGLRALQGPEGVADMSQLYIATDTLISQWHGRRFAGLVIYGPPGTGKTHAAIGLGRALYEAGAEVHYRFAPSLDGMSEHLGNWVETRAQYGKSERLTNAYSVFPQEHSSGDNSRLNRESVLIYDDYNPDNQKALAVATQAAAQFGGLVIITSNYEDPFKLVETPAPTKTPEQIALGAFAESVDPEASAAAHQQQEAKRAEFSASLRSRITAGFRFIHFEGPDHRADNSFWND